MRILIDELNLTDNKLSEDMALDVVQKIVVAHLLDLKKGLAESLTAWDIFPCTVDKAKVKFAIESDWFIFRP